MNPSMKTWSGCAATTCSRVFAFGDVDAERLLAENVEPGLQPGLDLRHMQPGWRAQEDRVQAFVLQHFRVVRIPDGSGEALGCPFQFLRHDAAHSGQLNAGCLNAMFSACR